MENTLKIIEDNTEIEVMLPWNGVNAMFKIFMLNATQLEACGNFSLINLEKKDGEKLTEEEQLDAILEVKNAQENIFKLCLVSPSFNDIVAMYEATDTLKRINAEIAKKRAELDLMPAGEAKYADKKELDMYEMFKGFMFPDDFTEKLTEIIYQKNYSDILRVSEKMLLSAALLAERGHNNPHEHISGKFTEYHKHDIDKHAWYLLNKYREEQEVEKDSKGSIWYRGR